MNQMRFDVFLDFIIFAYFHANCMGFHGEQNAKDC